MAYSSRTQTTSIEESLKKNTPRWGFFQAVRNLDSFYHSQKKEYARTGSSDKPQNENIRFKQKPSLGFNDSEIESYKTTSDENPNSMYLNFFGLWGANSPLPLVFTEHAFNRAKHHDDNSLVNFLDMFHHRMVSLFYKAWAINQQSVNADREEDDHFKKYLASIIGLGVFSSLKNISPVSLNSRLYFSGHVLHYTPNIASLTSILGDYFKTKAEIKPFMVEEIDIPKEDLLCLKKGNTLAALGKNFIIGKKFITSMMKFRVVLGPMKLNKYMELLHGKKGYHQLVRWVKFYVAGRFDFDIELILEETEIPDMSLGRMSALGGTCWLRTNSAVPVKNRTIIRV